MTLQEIKDAVDAGKSVYWHHKGYQVIKDKYSRYLIVFLSNGNCSALETKDGRMHEREEQFFIA